MRSAATLLVLLVLGFATSTAVAGHPLAGSLLTTSLPLTSTLPKITTTLPVSTTLPKITTTPPVTTTLPVTTTVPKVTTTVPKITTTVPVSTTLPRVTTTVPKITTTLPKVTTTLPVSTTLPRVTTGTNPLPGTTALPKVTAPSVVTRSRAGLGAVSSVTGGATSAGTSATSGSGVFLGGSSGASTPTAAAAALIASGSTSGVAGAAPAGLTPLRTSRTFIAYHGSKRERFTVIAFRLPHAARVRFTVVQVAPFCRVVGSFTVRAHAGMNKVRFRGRVHGRRLPAGTYEIGVRTVSGVLRRVTLVIVDSGKPTPAAVEAARDQNVCGGATAQVGARSLFGPLPFGATISQGATPAGSGTSAPAVLAATTQRSRQAFYGKALALDNPKSIVVLLFLAASALLLGIAAAPRRLFPTPHSAIAFGLEQRRLEVAGFGFTLLLVAIIAMVLS